MTTRRESEPALSDDSGVGSPRWSRMRLCPARVSQGPLKAKAMLTRSLEVFFAYARSSRSLHPLLQPVLDSYVDVSRTDLGLSEEVAQKQLSELARRSDVELTF